MWALRPVEAVVHLEATERRAALGGARGIEPLRGALLEGSWTPSQMGHSQHLFAPGGHGHQEGVTGFGSCR